MKYYSEVLEKFFDSSDALLNEEAKHLEKIAKEEEVLAKKRSAESNRKKELANAIDKCEEELDIAYKNLNTVKKECRELVKIYEDQMNEMLTPAEEAVKKAQENRLEAIRAFNKEFGVFKTTYTDERAQREMQRTAELFNNFWKKFNWMF